ncbi:hypothetical protein GINT2_001869 [Glugoides intestinalis]
MIISGRENITKNTPCREIYETLVEELSSMAAGGVESKNQVVNTPQENPFAKNSSSEETVDTFIPGGSLGVHIKEKANTIFDGISPIELNKIITTIIQIKNRSLGKVTKFCTNTEDFFNFLKLFSQTMRPGISPIESFIQVLEMDKNRAIVEPFAVKYFKVLFYMQKPVTPTFYELSIVYNMMKIYFKEDPYLKAVVDVIIKEFIVHLNTKYVSNTEITLTNSQVYEFTKIIKSMINAFNGTVIELEIEASDISKIIFVMMCFYFNRNSSVLYDMFGIRELFYCAVRSVYQGHMFAKKLECLISSKLRWRMKMENEEYTCDKVYQTLFKYEYKKIIGKIRYKEHCYSGSLSKSFNGSSHSTSSEKNQRVLITNIVKTTPKINKKKEKYAFSPLSRRIGDSLKKKESLDSKRKLKFDV